MHIADELADKAPQTMELHENPASTTDKPPLPPPPSRMGLPTRPTPGRKSTFAPLSEKVAGGPDKPIGLPGDASREQNEPLYSERKESTKPKEREPIGLGSLGRKRGFMAPFHKDGQNADSGQPDLNQGTDAARPDAKTDDQIPLTSNEPAQPPTSEKKKSFFQPPFSQGGLPSGPRLSAIPPRGPPPPAESLPPIPGSGASPANNPTPPTLPNGISRAGGPPDHLSGMPLQSRSSEGDQKSAPARRPAGLPPQPRSHQDNPPSPFVGGSESKQPSMEARGQITSLSNPDHITRVRHPRSQDD